MPVPVITDDRYLNSADFGTAYRLTPTDDADVAGRVFVDMSEHFLLVNGYRESRPKVRVRFFGLEVGGQWLGAATCTVLFHPDWTRPGSGIAVRVLGESGWLTAELGPEIPTEPDGLRATVAEVAQAVSARFLTDLVVAGYRYHLANRRRQHADRAEAIAQFRHDLAQRRSLDARTAADAADALLKAVHHRNERLQQEAH